RVTGLWTAGPDNCNPGGRRPAGQRENGIHGSKYQPPVLSLSRDLAGSAARSAPSPDQSVPDQSALRAPSTKLWNSFIPTLPIGASCWAYSCSLSALPAPFI